VLNILNSLRCKSSFYRRT